MSYLSQLSLTSDNVFGDDGGASQLATVTGDVGSGYTVTLPVRIETTTTRPAAARVATAPRPACPVPAARAVSRRAGRRP